MRRGCSVSRVSHVMGLPCYSSSSLSLLNKLPWTAERSGRYSLYTTVAEKAAQCNGISNRHTAAEENCGLCRCKTGRRPSFAFANLPYLPCYYKIHAPPICGTCGLSLQGTAHIYCAPARLWGKNRNSIRWNKIRASYTHLGGMTTSNSFIG